MQNWGFYNMPEQDRLYADFNKKEFVRDLNKKGDYLKFDNMKDLFIYAMALGAECPMALDGKKEGIFLDKDLNSEDKALIYALTAPELENIEKIADKETVYDIAQNMANMGFAMIEQTIESSSIENINKKLLVSLDEKYEELVNIKYENNNIIYEVEEEYGNFVAE